MSRDITPDYYLTPCYISIVCLKAVGCVAGLLAEIAESGCGVVPETRIYLTRGPGLRSDIQLFAFSLRLFFMFYLFRQTDRQINTLRLFHLSILSYARDPTLRDRNESTF